MKATRATSVKVNKPSFTLRDMHNIKQIHMDEIKRQQRSIQRLEWVIAGSVGASLALGFVIIHQIFFV
tara:strand:+ start:262 stop:465 length:204 start_codon:yes stop_codon:yes gene_type:complete